MNRKGRAWLTTIIILLIIIAILLIWLARGKREKMESQEVSAVPHQTTEEKIDMPLEKLDKAWEEAQKLARGGQGASVEVDYPKQMGSEKAKVRIDAFFPMGAGEGLTVSTNVLKKLADEYKDKLLVRISLLAEPVAKELGLDCAVIFINGSNHIKVDGEEIVLIHKNTHNPELLEKAVKQAIAQANGESNP